MDSFLESVCSAWGTGEQFQRLDQRHEVVVDVDVNFNFEVDWQLSKILGVLDDLREGKPSRAAQRHKACFQGGLFDPGRALQIKTLTYKSHIKYKIALLGGPWQFAYSTQTSTLTICLPRQAPPHLPQSSQYCLRWTWQCSASLQTLASWLLSWFLLVFLFLSCEQQFDVFVTISITRSWL